MKAIRDLAVQIREEVEELDEEKPLCEQIWDLQEIEQSAKSLAKKAQILRHDLSIRQRKEQG